MEMRIFIHNCERLKNKFGDKNVTKEILNEVWLKVKDESNIFIEEKVNALIKKHYQYEISVDDFVQSKNTDSALGKWLKNKDCVTLNDAVRKVKSNG